MLNAYVPRVTLEWLLDEPTARWRQLDGTLVFVDVSGFTALSERLAGFGRIGAEELTDTIGTCFDRLLQVAYADGASLLKFGGDALLLLLTGQDHVARACRTAVRTRDALADVGALDSSAGKISLEMSIGIESGPIDLFLVGQSHRELVVAGPVTTQTVEMESRAGPGQIVVGPAVARQLDAAELGDRIGAGRLLRRARDVEPSTAATTSTTTPTTTDPAVVEQAVPTALRAALAESDGGAEHRRASVAFLRFLGTDRLLREEGGPVAAAALDELVHVVQRAADHHGVTFLASDIDRDGGKLILVSGAPASHGNDPERLLLALRDIVDAETRLGVAIGVQGGLVFVGDVGPAFRRTYTVMGDVVNLAARLMARSLPRSILVTDEMLGRSGTAFRTDPLPPLTVKGRSEPVTAAVVGPVTGRRAAASTVDVPFVGRQEELATFDAIATPLDGSGHLIDVVGEPGIGKSRMLAAFRERTTDRVVVEVVGELHRASTPYGTVRRLLREQLGTPADADPTTAGEHLVEVLERERPDLVEWAPLISIAYGTRLPATAATRNLDERFLRARLHEVVLDLLRWRWSEPLLLTIEDAQWLDEASADLIGALTVGLSAVPWVVCRSWRTGDERFGEDVPTTEIQLGGLAEDELVLLSRALTEHAPMAAHDLHLLADRSGGNPLFLQELIGTAQATGGVHELPGSIESLVTARIDGLPQEQRELLREASVLGYSFPRRLATAVFERGAPEGLDQVPDFLSADGDTVRFNHAMIRDVSYAGLPYRRRRRLHAAAGDMIATDDPDRVELLSFHYHLAGRYADAWVASLRAGEQAATIYANHEAATFYRRALEVAPRVAGVGDVEAARVSEALGDALQRIGELEEAQSAYHAASAAVRDDPVAWARSVLKGARVRAQLEHYPQALRQLTRALKRLDGLSGDDAGSQRAQLLVWYAHLRLEQGRFAEAIERCTLAIEEAEPIADRGALAHAYRLLDWAYVEQGRPDLAVSSTKALQLYEELDDLPNQATVLNNLGGIAYWSGRWTEARSYYERANDLNEQVGDVIAATMGRNNVAEILADQGHWEDAARLFREVERTLLAANFRAAIAYVRSNLGRTTGRAGDHDEAEALLIDARQEARSMGASSQVLEASVRLAELEVLRGEPTRALTRLDEVRPRSDARTAVVAQEPMLHRVHGYALIQLGRLDEAHEALQRSLGAASARDAAYERALAQQALADLAEARGSEPDPELMATCRQTLDALGVERLPTVPLLVVTGS